MRTRIALLFIIGLVTPAVAALPSHIEFTSLDAVSGWISNYRAKPEPARLPAAVRALSQLGTFKDPESSGVYVGFVAGVISANPDRAEDLIGKMFPIAPVDHGRSCGRSPIPVTPNGRGCYRSSRRACRCGR